MSSYDLVAFDMDGTLLDSNKNVLQSSLDAIAKAKEQGKVVALSTGRNLKELEPLFGVLKNVPYAIAVSGGLIISIADCKRIYQSCVDEDTCQKIFDRTKSFDVMYHLHSDLSLVEKHCLKDMSRYQMGGHQRMFNLVSTAVDSIEDYYRQSKPPVYKFNLYCMSPSQREEIMPLLKDLPLTISYAEETSIECSAFGTSKGEGLKALCRSLNISIDRTIAVGDSDNDIAILKTAGLAAVMGNGKEHIKALADVVVSDNDHGGCAEVIEKYLLD